MRAGTRPGDVVIQALSLSMFTGGLPLSQGIMHLGACCVPVGVEGGTKRVSECLSLTNAAGGQELHFSIIGCADDMLILKGVNVYPAAIQNELFTFCPEITGAFRIVLDAPGPKVEPPLDLTVEHGAEIGTGQLDALASRIADHLRRSPAPVAAHRCIDHLGCGRLSASRIP